MDGAILIAICPWCMAETSLPPAVYMDGDHIEPWLCSDCGEPVAGRLTITTYPMALARLVERALETGGWVAE